MATSSLQLGQTAAARTIHDRATKAAENASWEMRSKAHAVGTAVAVTRGDIAAAAREAELALEAARRDGRFGGTIATLMSNLAMCKLILGDWRESEALAVAAIDSHELLGNDLSAATCRVNAVALFSDQGRWEEAEQMRRVAEDVLTGRDPEAAAYARYYGVRLRVRTGDGHAVLPEIEGFQGFEADIYGLRVEAALVRGDHDTARKERTSAAEAGVELERDAIFSGLLGGDLETVAAGEDPFDRVLARSILGYSLVEDEDAKTLGVVAVPVWAFAIASDQ